MASPFAHIFGFLTEIRSIGVNISMRPPETRDFAPTSRISVTLEVPLGAMRAISRAPMNNFVHARPKVVIRKFMMEQQLLSKGVYLHKNSFI